IRQAIRFNLVGFAFDEFDRAVQIGNGQVKTTQRYESMAAMTKEARVIGKLFRALCEGLDRGFVMTEVSRSSSEPDQVIGARVCLGVFACLGEFRFKRAPCFAREWRSDLLGALQTRLP